MLVGEHLQPLRIHRGTLGAHRDQCANMFVHMKAIVEAGVATASDMH